MKTMRKHLRFGINSRRFRQTVFSVLAKKIISGNTVPVHVVHVQKFIMIVEKNMVVENLAVRLDVIATAIWKYGNNVFTQFDNDGKGNYTELEQKNIDTGMGLERLAVVVQDVDSIFDIDTLKTLVDRVAEMAHTKYEEDAQKDISIRLITDHIRSVTFMISDGIMPSNEGRGYVLRRLLRRAARHGRLLGIEGTFLAELSNTVIETSKDGYPELEERKAMIFKVITEEENKFNRTIDQGLSILKEMEETMQKNGETVLGGEDGIQNSMIRMVFLWI